MTVLEDRIAMADSDDTSWLDDMFERLEKLPVPEGYKVEIVEGTIYMSPQRDIHWETILLIIDALRDHFGRRTRVFSDVRIDFPGRKNGLAPDVAKLRDGAEKNSEGRWRHEDVEFVAEVISTDTGRNDYGPKKSAYAVAAVPVYLIADPYQGKCHLYTQPKDGEYLSDTTLAYGVDVDMTATPLELTMKTDEFPRD
ncbi:Uma2 family endonuclease [Streptomyces sp. SID13726]|uniref:Uma2 family endonuclease n=1 Tax=Streptomyces sp. SID13726 TaxID=2706058 RepID=UPI0013B763A6|nr:Uma2 family endonuclease [Streptomyces sp. SID13726]NEB04989.1 Uma2 family endonuclease [Streptomyces sp. SID13726]